ncbi:hypothetical protein PEPS_00590 [Persicobacter psychrovividus]|uniref:DUF6787 domain-containing protein n=2 Tax=Persicobacter psychrovividus TaxID=387638 RepID=A0ABN6L8Z9_9BACT|nr:hypothetical protein PEPS_00590 [Persicobacter psychrovividus]
MGQEQKSGWLEKLAQRWELNSTKQVLLVLLVFSLTGSTVAYMRKGIFALFGYDDATPFWLKVITYIALVFPSYQILILVYGWIFGQFDFFWKKEKKMLQRMRLMKKDTDKK